MMMNTNAPIATVVKAIDRLQRIQPVTWLRPIVLELIKSSAAKTACTVVLSKPPREFDKTIAAPMSRRADR